MNINSIITAWIPDANDYADASIEYKSNTGTIIIRLMYDNQITFSLSVSELEKFLKASHAINT